MRRQITIASTERSTNGVVLLISYRLSSVCNHVRDDAHSPSHAGRSCL